MKKSLEKTSRKKRAVHEVPINPDAMIWKQLSDLVKKEDWKYKTNVSAFEARDRALICLLALTGCRISEALRLRREQFFVSEKEILLTNVVTEKHGNVRPRIFMYKTGSQTFLSQTFQTWLDQVPENSFVFPSGKANGFHWDRSLKRKRAHRIINSKTGLFPHWFRGVCETIYGRMYLENNAWELASFMGLKRLDSTMPYVQSSWESKMKKASKI